MAPRVCPCMRLQKGVKVLAIIDALLTLLFVIVCIATLAGLLSLNDEQLKLLKYSRTVLIILLTIDLAVSLVQFVMDILLYNGANQKRWAKCLIWLIVTGITLVKYISNIVNNASSGGGVSKPAFGFIIIFLGFKIYELLVVFTFIQQLRDERVQSGGIAGINPPSIAIATIPGSQSQAYDPNGMQFAYATPEYQNQYQTQYQQNVYSNV